MYKELLDLNNEVINGKIKYNDNLELLAKLHKRSKKRLSKNNAKYDQVLAGKLRPLTYKEYMGSKLWEVRKDKYFLRHARECAKCGSTTKIELHHLRYSSKQFGVEQDNDLCPLCQDCHKDFHNKYGTHTNMHAMHKEWMAA